MLPALTYDRVKRVLDDLELMYHEEDDVIYINFPAIIARIEVSERLLTIEALWRGILATEADTATALETCHYINSTAVFPKCYVRRIDDQEASAVNLEFQMPVERGVSDEQLYAYCNNAFGWFFAAVDTFNDELPHLVLWDKED